MVRGCDGLSKHAHFHNFGMAFLTLFRIATGDNWNGIMKDTLKDNVLCQDDNNKEGSSICLASVLAPIYFVIFVLMAQFVLVNVVVAVLMKHLDVIWIIHKLLHNQLIIIIEQESNKMQADDAEMDEEIEKQLENEARNNLFTDDRLFFEDDAVRIPPQFWNQFNWIFIYFEAKRRANSAPDEKSELITTQLYIWNISRD